MRIRIKPAGWAFLLFLIVALAIGRIALHRSPQLGNATAVDLSGDYTRDGISYDTNPGDGGLDATNDTKSPTSYSVEALGGSPVVSIGSARFEMGPYTDHQNNVVDAKGQKITLPDGHFHNLLVLATSVNGDATAEFGVIYGSGSPQSFSLHITDWCIGPHGNEAGTKPMDYRNGPDGGEKVGLHLSYFQIPLDSDRSAQAVQLPKDDHIKVLAMSLT